MNNAPITRAIVIQNPQGLHARPAEVFARLATQFQSRVELIKDNERVDAKSILHLLTLGARQGTELLLEAEGHDAAEAIEALSRLVQNGFASEENETCQEEAAG